MTSDFRVGIWGSKMTPNTGRHRLKIVGQGRRGVQKWQKMSDVIYGRSLMGLWNDQINPIRDYWTADLLNVHKITTFPSYALLRWCATQWSQEILRDPPDQQKFSDLTTHRNTLILFYITSSTPFHSKKWCSFKNLFLFLKKNC